jgi:hypothetical protein
MGRQEEALGVLLECRGLHEAMGQQKTSGYFRLLVALAKLHQELSKPQEAPDGHSQPVETQTDDAADHAAKAMSLVYEATQLAKELKITSDHHDNGVREGYSWVTAILSTGAPTAAKPGVSGQ